MVPDPIGVDSLRRVLVVKLRHHGDVLLTSPVFRVLAARAPQAEIDALVYADDRRIGVDTWAYKTGVLTAVELGGEGRRFLQARRGPDGVTVASLALNQA